VGWFWKLAARLQTPVVPDKKSNGAIGPCLEVGVSSCDGWVGGEGPEGYGARWNAHNNFKSNIAQQPYRI
jgi:hypothetical protein